MTESGKMMSVNSVQDLKVDSAIFFNNCGNFTFLSLRQNAKEYLSITETESGISIFIKPLSLKTP